MCVRVICIEKRKNERKKKYPRIYIYRSFIFPLKANYWRKAFKKGESVGKKKTKHNMRESNWASLWLPVNWVTQLVIVSDHQTNSHSYVCALAPFSSGAVPLRPLKAKELTGQGFKPISSFGTAAITTGGKQLLATSSFLKKAFLMLAAHLFFFSPEVRGQWQRRIPINSLVTFPSSWSNFSLLTIRLAWSQWNVSVLSVSRKNPFQNCIYFEKYSKYLFRTSWSLTGDKTCAICPEMWHWVIDNSFYKVHLIPPLSPLLSACWKFLEIRKHIIRNNLLSHYKCLEGLRVANGEAEETILIWHSALH